MPNAEDDRDRPAGPVRCSRIVREVRRGCRRRAGRGRARARCRRSAWAGAGVHASIMRGADQARRVVASGASVGGGRGVDPDALGTRSAPGVGWVRPDRPAVARGVDARRGHPVGRLGDERDLARLRTAGPDPGRPRPGSSGRTHRRPPGRTGCRRTCAARPSACSAVSGVIRYGRAAVIASNASATWRIRASFGISSPMSRSG